MMRMKREIAVFLHQGMIITITTDNGRRVDHMTFGAWKERFYDGGEGERGLWRVKD